MKLERGSEPGGAATDMRAGLKPRSQSQGKFSQKNLPKPNIRSRVSGVAIRDDRHFWVMGPPRGWRKVRKGSSLPQPLLPSSTPRLQQLPDATPSPPPHLQTFARGGDYAYGFKEQDTASPNLAPLSQPSPTQRGKVKNLP